VSIKQKALQGIVWSIVQNWGSQAVSFVVFLILARLLVPEAFGLVSLANVFLAFMQIFLEQGFTPALIQRQTLDSEHLDTAFWTQIITGLILTLAGFGLASFVAEIFTQPQLTPLLRCFSFLFFINSLGQVPKALLIRRFEFKSLALRSLIGILMGGTVGIVMAFNNYGVWSLVSQQFIYELTAVIVLWGLVAWRPHFRFSRSHFQDLFQFGISIFAFKFIKFFNKRSDNLLIGYFLGEVALGYYAIAYRILEVTIQLLVSTSNQVALPTFSRLQEEPERFRKAFYKATQFTSVIAFPTFTGMAILAPELVINLFGEKWQASIPIMQILAFMGILYAISNFNWSAFTSMGKPAWRLWLSLLNAALNIIACIFAVQWGIIAVAYAYTISSYLVFPISHYALNRLIKIPLGTYLHNFITPLISTLMMVGGIAIAKIILVDRLDSKIMLLSCTILGIILYSISIKLFDPKLFDYLLGLVTSTISAKTKKTTE
jgi:O-antigen/teichoic acid export membrane protein